MAKQVVIRNNVIASLVFLVTYKMHEIMGYTGLRGILDSVQFSIAVNLIQIIVCISAVMLVFRLGPRGAFKELGMLRPLNRAIVFSLVATLPILIGFGIFFSIDPKLSLAGIFAFAFLSPFAEELVFRGYIFRQLYRRGGLGFWTAALLPSMLFGFGHLYQSKGTWDFVGITLITGLGSLFFCWIFLRWQDNLWIPIGLHMLMNLWWMVFAVDDTALGGWLANILRILTVLVAVGLTVKQEIIWNPLPEEKFNNDNSQDKDKNVSMRLTSFT